MNKMTIHHIGMAVPSIEGFRSKNQILYGQFSVGGIIENARQKVREAFMTDGNTIIELLEPIGPDSPLAAFLKRNGAGGLVHVALEVDDVGAAIRQVKAAGGVLLVGPVPDVAFEERSIAFVAIDGQVTELIERSKQQASR